MFRCTTLRWALPAVTVFGLCSFVSGCGGKTTTPSSKSPPPTSLISGTVKLNDKVVNYGSVEFHPDSGRPFKTFIDVEGGYKIYNAPAGEVRVVVVTGSAPRPAAGGSDATPPDFKTIHLPEKYSDPKTTDLRYSVELGDHTFDINMKADPEPEIDAKPKADAKSEADEKPKADAKPKPDSKSKADAKPTKEGGK